MKSAYFVAGLLSLFCPAIAGAAECLTGSVVCPDSGAQPVPERPKYQGWGPQGSTSYPSSQGRLNERGECVPLGDYYGPPLPAQSLCELKKTTGGGRFDSIPEPTKSNPVGAVSFDHKPTGSTTVVIDHHDTSDDAH